jgi:hypothetical protein
MANAVVNALPESEFLLVQETAKGALAALTEDELIDLHARVRRARSKYVSQYRRGASARVSAAGGRGKARPQNATARDRAEVFEDALARVSKALSDAARRSAAELKAERIAAAQAAKAGVGPSAGAPAPAASRGRSATTAKERRTPRTTAARAKASATTARRQAAKDAR